MPITLSVLQQHAELLPYVIQAQLLTDAGVLVLLPCLIVYIAGSRHYMHCNEPVLWQAMALSANGASRCSC